MKKYAYFLRLGIAAIVFGLSVAVFTNAFYPLKIFDLQFMALLQRTFADFSLAALILLGLVVLMTLLFGRFYCSLLCPLGVFQELCGLVFRRKLNPQKHSFYKCQCECGNIINIRTQQIDVQKSCGCCTRL